MVNKLGNTPEKVTSTTNRSGSSILKKIVAGAIALTLSGQPAEAKTFNKQEFTTEMVTNIPGENSSMTENVEQTNIPNYIMQAESGVRKYCPQYEQYFKPIFRKANNLSPNNQDILDIINKKIQENFALFDEELPTEKDRITTILLTLENIISGQDQLSNEIKGSAKGKDLIEISNEISNDVKKRINKEVKQNRETINQNREETILIQKRTKKLHEIINYINGNEVNKETMNIIVNKIEEYFKLFEIREINKDNGLQNIIKHYITYTKQINRIPSNIGKEFIKEYNRIKNK